MSEEIKNENVEEVLDVLIEKHNLKNDDRFQKVVKMIMFGYLITKNEDEVETFLKTQGWDINDYDVALEKYMKSLYPELDL